jgi:hypothetical protein
VKVAKDQCYLSKAKGGINLVDPLDATVALLCKWVLVACEPSQSNLHMVLRFRLNSYQPYGGGEIGNPAWPTSYYQDMRPKKDLLHGTELGLPGKR